MNLEQARAAHPAFKGDKATDAVPLVEILTRVVQLIDEHQWLYGKQDSAAATRQERWDVRSIVGYAIMSKPGHFRPTYGTFYHQRNVVCGLLIVAANDYFGDNIDRWMSAWGDWRIWETDSDTTGMQILLVAQKALKRAKDLAG